MRSFREWLREEMKVQGFSQARLAQLAGLSPTTVCNALNGKRELGKLSLIKVAQVLQLPVEFVFEKAGVFHPTPELSTVKRKLAHVAKELPDSDVSIALTMLEQRLKFYKEHPKARPAN